MTCNSVAPKTFGANRNEVNNKTHRHRNNDPDGLRYTEVPDLDRADIGEDYPCPNPTNLENYGVVSDGRIDQGQLPSVLQRDPNSRRWTYPESVDG